MQGTGRKSTRYVKAERDKGKVIFTADRYYTPDLLNEWTKELYRWSHQQVRWEYNDARQAVVTAFGNPAEVERTILVQKLDFETFLDTRLPT